jgi:type IV secretory pathway VirB4 component
VLSQSFAFLSRPASQTLLQRQYFRMLNAGDFAVSQAAQLKEALDALTSNEFVMGEHHFSLQVMADVPDGEGVSSAWRLRPLNDHVAQARNLLADCGMTVAREDLALEAAFWAQLPGNFALRPRQAAITSRNFAAMFGSIRSVAGSAAAALEYLQGQRTRAFSVRRWVRAGHGVLFLPYGAAQIPALRSIIATWMRLAIFESMSGQTEQRLWFVVDELDALGQIDGLKDALARLRKFGGRCVLGFQSIAQVSATYGAGEAQTMVENCATTLILRCSGSEHGGTSQFASRLIGEREVLRRQNSRGRDHEGHFSLRGARRSHSVSEQTVTETAVLAAELEQLPDLTGYLKTAGSPEWRRVRLA